MNKVYQVVTTESTTYFTKEELLATYSQKGVNTNLHNREEIQGEPRFFDLLGPMYNGTHEGKTCIRYESLEAYLLMCQ